jgi:hypothetical protein
MPITASTPFITTPFITAEAVPPEDPRIGVVRRIHALLLHEMGEDIDINLMLGPAEYARAVMSLCRASGNPELSGLAEDFLRRSRAQAHQSPRPATRYAEQLAQQQ